MEKLAALDLLPHRHAGKTKPGSGFNYSLNNKTNKQKSGRCRRVIIVIRSLENYPRPREAGPGAISSLQ